LRQQFDAAEIDEKHFLFSAKNSLRILIPSSFKALQISIVDALLVMALRRASFVSASISE
jgi:hypothetical protein